MAGGGERPRSARARQGAVVVAPFEQRYDDRGAERVSGSGAVDRLDVRWAGARELVAELYAFYSGHHRRRYGWDGAPVHDAVALSYVVDPTLLTVEDCGVRIDTGGELSRGRTYVDVWAVTDWERNSHVAVEVDSERFFALLLERIARLP